MRHEIVAARFHTLYAKIFFDQIDPLRRIHGYLEQSVFFDLRAFEQRSQFFGVILRCRKTHRQQMAEAVFFGYFTAVIACFQCFISESFQDINESFKTVNASDTLDRLWKNRFAVPSFQFNIQHFIQYCSGKKIACLIQPAVLRNGVIIAKLPAFLRKQFCIAAVTTWIIFSKSVITESDRLIADKYVQFTERVRKTDQSEHGEKENVTVNDTVLICFDIVRNRDIVRVMIVIIQVFIMSDTICFDRKSMKQTEIGIKIFVDPLIEFLQHLMNHRYTTVKRRPINTAVACSFLFQP